MPKITTKGNVMTIVIDLANPGQPSKTGKTQVIASTHGNLVVPTDLGPITVGLNVYKKL